MAGGLHVSSVLCDARSLVKPLQLGTSPECGQNVVESVTPKYSAPEIALTVLHLNLHLTLQLPAPPLTNHPLSAV